MSSIFATDSDRYWWQFSNVEESSENSNPIVDDEIFQS